MRDLEQDAVIGFIKAFSAKMRSMREQIARLDKLHYRFQKEAVFLDAIAFYCDAVAQLAKDLQAAHLESRGLDRFRRHVEDYVKSVAFSSLENTMREIKRDLAAIEYELFIGNSSVTVRKFESEPDYGAAVAATFERFKQGAVKDYEFKLADFFEMNHVEAHILDFVAALHPDLFGRLDRHFSDNQAYLDPAIGRWDREIQFYVAYLDTIRPLRGAGLRFCYPALSDTSKAVRARATFDIALANKLVSEKASVVTDDFELSGRERVFVVSGPNQDDLVRLREVLARATPNSIVILNEIFTSTTLRDALFLARRVLDRLMKLDLLCVCVTFMDELSSLGPQTVSLVSTVVPDNPAERTYRVIRRHLYPFAHAMEEMNLRAALFLRAERREDGSGTFKLFEGKPLETSFGEDLYKKIFGADAESQQAPPRLRAIG